MSATCEHINDRWEMRRMPGHLLMQQRTRCLDCNDATPWTRYPPAPERRPKKKSPDDLGSSGAMREPLRNPKNASPEERRQALRTIFNPKAKRVSPYVIGMFRKMMRQRLRVIDGGDER